MTSSLEQRSAPSAETPWFNLSPAEAIEEVVLACSAGGVDGEPVVGEPPVDGD